MSCSPVALRSFPLIIGGRGWILLSIAVAGIWAGLWLGLDPREILPNAGGLQVAGEFFARLGRAQPAEVFH